MYDNQSLSHTMWECKYHIVWILKYRKKTISEASGNIWGERVV